LLDAGLRPVPIGIPGELHVAGPGLARGYLRRPALTAEKFIPSPFDAGERLYRTGDLARYLPDGRVDFLGRIDHQVKIRGFRIELGEIEAVLGRHPEVREAVVEVRSVEGSAARSVAEQQLVAYVVRDRETAELDTGAARAYLGESLPEYMVPAVFVPLDALPLTPNGKVDRAALRRLPLPAEAARSRRDATHEAPRTEAEQRIAEVWREVLGLDEVGIRDNFFDLGGHSLLLAEVRGKLRRVLDRELSIVDLFQYPTIRALAEHLVPDSAAELAVAASARTPVAAGSEIAVIGLAGRFPGAGSIEAFWRNLRDGLESITFFSDQELIARGV
ncbi:MAG: AMP-binding protein, partial [bacterium]|nr:AMP-binding protein [bacterium]